MAGGRAGRQVGKGPEVGSGWGGVGGGLEREGEAQNRPLLSGVSTVDPHPPPPPPPSSLCRIDVCVRAAQM